MPRARRARDPDRGAKILAAASRLFLERSFNAVSVDEIGEAAGATGAAIYRHFASKEEILSTLFDEALDQYLVAIPNARPHPADPVADLEALVHRHVAFTIAHRELASLWAHEHRTLTGDYLRRINRRTRQYVDRWVDVLRRVFPDRQDDDLYAGTLAAIGTTNSLSAGPSGPLGERQQAIVCQMLMASLLSLETVPPR